MRRSNVLEVVDRTLPQNSHTGAPLREARPALDTAGDRIPHPLRPLRHRHRRLHEEARLRAPLLALIQAQQ